MAIYDQVKISTDKELGELHRLVLDSVADAQAELDAVTAEMRARGLLAPPPAVSDDPRMWWMTDGQARRWVADVGDASDLERVRGWLILAEVEIPEAVTAQLDVIAADAIESGYEGSDLDTYGDVFEYVCDGCYLEPGGKPGAASYDPGADPVAIAYAIVLGYEQGIRHLLDQLRSDTTGVRRERAAAPPHPHPPRGRAGRGPGADGAGRAAARGPAVQVRAALDAAAGPTPGAGPEGALAGPLRHPQAWRPPGAARRHGLPVVWSAAGAGRRWGVRCIEGWIVLPAALRLSSAAPRPDGCMVREGAPHLRSNTRAGGWGRERRLTGSGGRQDGPLIQ